MLSSSLQVRVVTTHNNKKMEEKNERTLQSTVGQKNLS